MLSQMIQPLGGFFEHLADFFYYLDATLASIRSQGFGGYALAAFIGCISIFKRRKPRVFPH
jgi:hypothetical protein